MILEPVYMDDLRYDDPSHTYRVEGRLVPHITEIVPSDYSHVKPHHLELARQRGTAVHKATELYDLRTLNYSSLDPRVVPYLEGWAQFTLDYEFECDDYDVERRLYHPIDRYAGTGDRPRCWIKPPGRGRTLVTLEIKSIARMTEEVGLQTAGQQRAENHRARALGLAPTEGRFGVKLQKDGKYKVYPYTDRRHEQVFLSYLVCLNWEVHTKQRKLAVQQLRAVA